MSKLDALLSLVDGLSTKSDEMVSSICDSNTLIGLILELNGSIASADSEIDTMTEVINKNNICLNELEKLYEKSFFLESNLHLNQLYTNETSLDNLEKEYSYLLSSFGHHNVRHFAQEEVKPPSENRELKNMLSISNLDLKPIRCRSSKVSKQKSRYRLSAAYTLNPLQENPVRNFSKSSHETEYSSLMEQISHNSSSTSMGNDDTVAHSMDTSPINMDHSDSLEDTFDNHETPKRENRLFTFGGMSPVNLNSVNLDELEEYEFDLSDTSPTSSNDDFDNFHKFLRQSRVDLQTAFPAPLKKAVSAESVFSAVQIPTQPPAPPKFHNPALMLTAHAKETINMPTVETIYSSSIKSNNSVDIPKSMANFREHSRRLLHEVLADIPESPTRHMPITPKRKSNFTLFNLLNSPMGSPSGFSQQSQTNPKEGARRGSIDMMSKSLASGFMNLVGSSQSLKTDGPVTHKAVQFSPPEKIKKLKKGIRDPIEIRNELHNKRLPPHERNLQNGSHSSLTIGPGNRKIINHGESSIFKRPTVRRMSQQLLDEALSDSIIF